jgi:phenylacetate-CoA ligase
MNPMKDAAYQDLGQADSDKLSSDSSSTSKFARNNSNAKRRNRSRVADVALALGSMFGGPLFKSLKEMRAVQWSSPDELHHRNEARLALLLKHAAHNVPFYRNLYKELGLASDDLFSVSDLSALPILRKSDYRERKAEVFHAANVEPYFRIDRSTSGSTGEPFNFSIDRRALPIVFASHLFYDSWHGLRPIDRYIRIMSPPPIPPPLPPNSPASVRFRQAIMSRIQRFYESRTQERVSMWEIDSARARAIWGRIEAFRPKFVMGYTSSLAAIADELLHQDLKLSHPVSGIITIAETLSPNRRRLVDEYFRAPIINRYGLREFGSWSAQSCDASPDQFHINTELVVCEILRNDGTPCDPGEMGRVVLTDLHNFARPFIRYDTGDLAIAGSSECSCGRGFPMLGQIEGRSQECLRTPSGKEISPAVLGHYLFVYNNYLEVVRHYQLIQESANRVKLLIVPDAGWNDQKRDELTSDLTRLIENEMEVAVETVAGIPLETSGKRPIIKISQN